jgi:CRISPR system Cascade subunit CasC
VFGGVNRVRVSSQSLKHAMRKSDYYRQFLGDPSFRTRKLGKSKAELLKTLKDEFEKDLIEDAADRFVAATALEEENGGGEEADAEEAEGEEAKEEKRAVAPWVKEEIRVLCRIIKEAKKEGLSEDEKEKAIKKIGKEVGKGKDKRRLTESDCLKEALNQKIDKKIKERLSDLRSAIGKAADVALSGRMATGGLMMSVDGAMAVAHAITTHAVEQDVDWFTAVDDLTQDSGETGAGHLDTQQFSSGVFYRYASLNLKQLQVNLGLIPDMKSAESAEGRKKALEIAKHVLHMLATVVPSAKRNSFGQDNLADFAIVGFADQPISLANAFERPVAIDKKGGFLKSSSLALVEYWRKMNDAYELNEISAAFRFDNFPWEEEAKKEKGIKWPENLKVHEKLENIKTWIARDGADK